MENHCSFCTGTPPTTDALTVTPSPHQSQRDEPHTPRRRSSFHTAFSRWATSTGAALVKSLKWAIPSVDSANERTRHTAPCALNIPGPKLTEALINHGVPFAAAYGPSWGPGHPEWESARKLFHVPCNCVPDVGQPVAIGFSRCSTFHGFSIQ